MDLVFSRNDIIKETVARLQHYKIVQMYSQSINLTPDYETLGTVRRSFLAAYTDNPNVVFSKEYGFPHPGFAWAATREAINELGGLPDTHILGSGDLMLARALIGRVEEGLNPDLSNGYKESLSLLQDRCNKFIKRNIGYVPGLILHHWHGSRKSRRYGERWKILTDHKFDSEFDLRPDWQGLWQFTGNKPQLEYDCRAYFESRKEDSTCIEHQ